MILEQTVCVVDKNDKYIFQTADKANKSLQLVIYQSKSDSAIQTFRLPRYVYFKISPLPIFQNKFSLDLKKIKKYI